MAMLGNKKLSYPSFSCVAHQLSYEALIIFNGGIPSIMRTPCWCHCVGADHSLLCVILDVRQFALIGVDALRAMGHHIVGARLRLLGAFGENWVGAILAAKNDRCRHSPSVSC